MIASRWDISSMPKHVLLLPAVTTAALGEQHTLASTPTTVHRGYYLAKTLRRKAQVYAVQRARIASSHAGAARPRERRPWSRRVNGRISI